MLGDFLSCQRHVEDYSESTDAAGEEEQLSGKCFRGVLVSTTQLQADKIYDQADRRMSGLDRLCDGEFPDQRL